MGRFADDEYEDYEEGANDDGPQVSYGADDGVKALFGSDVDEIVWRETLSDVAPPGSTFVDVVLTSAAPKILKTDRKIALGYWPSGPVVKGVQNYSEGQTISFPRILIKPGAELVLVSSSSLLEGSLAANVSVENAGGGQARVDASDNNKGEDPLSKLTANLGTGLAVVVGLLVLFVVIKGEVTS